MTDAQNQANELSKAQLENTRKNTELLERELARLESETTADNAKKAAETEKIRHQMRESVLKLGKELELLQADIILTLEKAETEDVQNNISIYTAKLDALRAKTDAIGAINDATSARAVNPGNTLPIRIQPPLAGTA